MFKFATLYLPSLSYISSTLSLTVKRHARWLLALVARILYIIFLCSQQHAISLFVMDVHDSVVISANISLKMEVKRGMLPFVIDFLGRFL